MNNRAKRDSTEKIPYCDSEKYKVKMVPLDKIKPSPENDELYGEMQHDEQMERLIDSIRRRGLSDPLLLTKDNFVLSGHRRHYAISWLGYKTAPCYTHSNLK